MLEKSELQPGQTISHYRVVRALGSGGMGSVFLAEDLTLLRKVALKVITIPTQLSDDERKSLLREAQSLAALNHPNIVSIYDLLEEDGKLILVMELVDGHPLNTILGKVSTSHLIRIAQQLASALAAAHKAGMIHGDVKPTNILIDDETNVQLLDFGIARSLDFRIAAQSEYSGTTPYMAPELIRGGKHSPQTDLWPSVLHSLNWLLAKGLLLGHTKPRYNMRSCMWRRPVNCYRKLLSRLQLRRLLRNC